MAMRVASLLLLTLLLGACGFHLRGYNVKGTGFAFNSIYIRSPGETPLTAGLRHELELNKIVIKGAAEQADLVLDIVSEGMDKQILALSGSGHVLEYVLTYRVSLRAYDRQQQEWIPAREISLQRNMSYDDAKVLAKEQEEALFYRDMHLDAVQLIMRRLSAVKAPQLIIP